MIKKITVLFLVLCLSVGVCLLAGCGKSSSGKEKTHFSLYSLPLLLATAGTQQKTGRTVATFLPAIYCFYYLILPALSRDQNIFSGSNDTPCCVSAKYRFVPSTL